MSRLVAGCLALVVTLALSAAEEAEHLPEIALRGQQKHVMQVYDLKGPVVYTLRDERNTLVLEVSPDGYVRVVRVVGIVGCAVPVQGKNIEFTLLSGQRIGIWSIERIEAEVRGLELAVRLTPPMWAVALEVEFGGLTGLTVRYEGHEGVLFTGQRMDTIADRQSNIVLARSGRGVLPQPPVPAAPVRAERPADDLAQPGARRPPEGWHRQPDWTVLPLLPAIIEPVPPEIVSP